MSITYQRMFSILYVDDEPTLLEVGKMFLELTGTLRVETAISAAKAIEHLKETSFDCVVADYQMPEMDGIAFLKYVRSQWPELPFILFTGRGREEIVIESINNGADSYVQKGGDPTSQFAELRHRVMAAIERRKAVCALRESEDRYRAVVESQTELISRFLPDGTHIFVNDAYCRYFSKTAVEILGTRFHPATSTDDERAIADHLAHLTPEHPEAILEHAITTPSGEIRWQQWSDRAFFDEQGKVREYQSVGRDITDRKRQEKELRRSQYLLQEAMDLARMAYWEYDAGSETFTFNDRFYRLLQTNAEREGGYQMSAATYLQEFVHPEDRTLMASITEEVLRDPSRVVAAHREHRIIRRDGLIRHVIARIRITKAPGDTPMGSYGHGSVQDITDAMLITQALQESEEKYRSILENIQDVYYRSDSEGRLVLASPSALTVFGYTTLSELYGKDIALTMYADPGERERLLAEIQKDGMIVDREVVLKRKDGSLITVSTSSHPYYDANGNFKGVEGIFRDITHRKRIEAALVAAVDRITAAEEELRQQYDELRRRGEALAESETTYRTIFENTGTATVLIDDDMTIALANAEFERLSGYSKAELEGKKKWTEFVHQDDLDRMIAEHKNRRESNDTPLKRYAFRFVTRSGEIRTVTNTVDMIPGTRRSVSSLLDITHPA